MLFSTLERIMHVTYNCWHGQFAMHCNCWYEQLGYVF